MTHSIPHAMLQFMGAFAGFLAVTIAVYMQTLTSRTCKLRYVTGFFVLGAALLLIHFGAFGVQATVSVWISFFGYVVLIVGELYAGWWVIQHSHVEPPHEAVAEALDPLISKSK